MLCGLRGIEKYKSELKLKQQEYKIKRNSLNEVYKELIEIINLYPSKSPNDILKWIKELPHYSLEHFDIIITLLDYKLDNYNKRLNNENISYDDKNDIKTEISNIEYAKQEISRICDMYFNAKDRIVSFFLIRN